MLHLDVGDVAEALDDEVVVDFFGEGGGGGVEGTVLGVDVAEQAVDLGVGDVEAFQSGREFGGEGEVGQQRDTEAGIHEGTDGVEFAGFAGDLGLEAGAAAGVDGDVAGAAFVEDEGVIAVVHEAGGVYAFRLVFAHKEIEGLADEAVDFKLALIGGELQETEVGEARGDGFGDAGGAVFEEGEFDVGIFGAVFLDDGREPAADEGGDGAEGQATTLEFVHVAHGFAGLAGHVEDELGALMQEFAGRSEADAGAVADDEFGLEVFLELLDLFTECALGQVKGSGGMGDVPVTGDGEEVFELVEFHRKKR